VVARIIETNPGCPLIVWCNEDTPLIWGDVMRALAGLPDDIALGGEFDMLEHVMTREGMAELRAHLDAQPHMLPADRREKILDLLEASRGRRSA
jgi:hypothetical protein